LRHYKGFGLAPTEYTMAVEGFQKSVPRNNACQHELSCIAQFCLIAVKDSS